jgi:ribose/xylose/arabinose/galactoside ABC-type transport system permease subunit
MTYQDPTACLQVPGRLILGPTSGGLRTGRPLGVALGVLTLGLLRAGLNALGAPPFINDIALGAILLAVGVLDGPEIARRLKRLQGT